MEIRKVGVVGLGTMGAGIAQVSVQSGFDTVGHEISEELGERGRATIERYLSRGVEKGRLVAAERDAALGRLTLTTNLADLADCDLVIEAVLEELELKREVFAELDRATRPEAILATNTSALSVAEIAEATQHPERVVGMHFFNPAPVLPLVEIVRAPRSSDETVQAAYDWAERAGKQPVRCNDTPGFIVNRILIPLLNDCVRVLDEAGVSPEDLDTAMTAGAGWPMGPCALIDLIGIDVHVHASQALHDALGEERMAPPQRLLEMRDAAPVASEGRAVHEAGAGEHPRLAGGPLHDIGAFLRPACDVLDPDQGGLGPAELAPLPAAAQERPFAPDLPREVVRREEHEPPAEIAEAPDYVVGVRRHVLLMLRKDDQVVGPAQGVAGADAGEVVVGEPVHLLARPAQPRDERQVPIAEAVREASARIRPAQVDPGDRAAHLPGVTPAVAVLVGEVVRLPGVGREDDGDPVLA